jgi:uncharacterized membrane-anchored protein
MSNKLLQDGDGNQSSKRIAGFVFGAAALAGGIAAIFLKTEASIAVEIVKMFLVASVSLLVGGTAAEQIGRIGK